MRATHLQWALSTPFRISRGVKTTSDAVMVELHDGPFRGRGEAIPYARYGETVDGVLEQIRTLEPELGDAFYRTTLQDRLPPGAARNAVDCALWDLEAKRSGRTIHQVQQGLTQPPLATAFTVGLDTPEAMAAAAEALRGFRLVKIKVDHTDPEAQIQAVRSVLPDADLIVDPNESWSLDILQRLQPLLRSARISLIEQPLPADQDEALEGFRSAAPICADESCHTVADLPRLRNRYQVVNIKLDKTGGLTAALELYQAARDAGFGVMAGCMICSSLGIAPAFVIGRQADFVDLDGPLWLADDWVDGAWLDQGGMHPPKPELWGGGRA